MKKEKTIPDKERSLGRKTIQSTMENLKGKYVGFYIDDVSQYGKHFYFVFVDDRFNLFSVRRSKVFNYLPKFRRGDCLEITTDGVSAVCVRHGNTEVFFREPNKIIKKDCTTGEEIWVNKSYVNQVKKRMKNGRD